MKERKALGGITNLRLGNQNDNLLGPKRNVPTAPLAMISLPKNSSSLPPNHSCADISCKLKHDTANLFLPMGVQPLDKKEKEKVLRVGEGSKKRNFPALLERLSEDEEKKVQEIIAEVDSNLRKRTIESEEN